MLNPIYRTYAAFSLLLLVLTIPCKAESQDLTDFQLRELLRNKTVYGFLESGKRWEAYFASHGRVYFRYTNGKLAMANWRVQNNMVCFYFDDGSQTCKTANPQGQFYEWRDTDFQRRATSRLIDFKPGDYEGIQQQAQQIEGVARQPEEPAPQVRAPAEPSRPVSAPTTNETWEILLGLAVIIGVVWLFLVILRAVFSVVKAVLGWIGPVLMGSVPGVIIFFLTKEVFGEGTTEASAKGIVTAVLVGVIGNMMDSSSD
jgi:hypothetical protein